MIVVSNDAYNRGSADVVVVAMTSNPAKVPFSFQVTASDLVEGSLNRPGTVRVDKIYTLAQSIIVKKFGKMSPRIVQRIRQMLELIMQPTLETNQLIARVVATGRPTR